LELRQQISVQLGCPVDQFQICRSVLGNQFKDENLSIEELGIYDGQTIFIKPGEPLKANQVKINFSIYDREHDTFTTVQNVHQVPQDIPILDIRKLVDQEPQVANRHLPGLSYLRLRGQHGKKAGPILFDSSTLKEAIPTLTDHQTIAVQILDRPEFVRPNQVLVQVQRWYPSTQELQEKGEDIVLPEGSNILTLKKHLALHQQHILEEHITLAKPYSYQLKNKNTLSSLLKWDIDSETLINDGDLVLYKDIRDQEVEIEGYRSPREGGLKMEVTRPKEVSLKIHTRYDEEGRAKFDVLLKDKEKTNAGDEEDPDKQV